MSPAVVHSTMPFSASSASACSRSQKNRWMTAHPPYSSASEAPVNGEPATDGNGTHIAFGERRPCHGR